MKGAPKTLGASAIDTPNPSGNCATAPPRMPPLWVDVQPVQTSGSNVFIAWVNVSNVACNSCVSTCIYLMISFSFSACLIRLYDRSDNGGAAVITDKRPCALSSVAVRIRCRSSLNPKRLFVFQSGTTRESPYLSSYPLPTAPSIPSIPNGHVNMRLSCFSKQTRNWLVL